jgi:hypothetical protein
VGEGFTARELKLKRKVEEGEGKVFSKTYNNFGL